MFYSNYYSKIGEILIKSDGEYLTGLWFIGQKFFPCEKIILKNCSVIDKVKKWLDSYFLGENPKRF